MSNTQKLKARIKELEDWYFLVDGIVRCAKEVLEKQHPQPLMANRGLPYEEWKLYVAIENYDRLMSSKDKSLEEE